MSKKKLLSHKIRSLSLLESVRIKMTDADAEARAALRAADLDYASPIAQQARAYAEGLRAAYMELRVWIDAEVVRQHDDELRAAEAVDAILKRRSAEVN